MYTIKAAALFCLALQSPLQAQAIPIKVDKPLQDARLDTLGGGNATSIDTDAVLVPRWYSIKSKKELHKLNSLAPGLPRIHDLWPGEKFTGDQELYPAGITRHFIHFCFGKKEDADALADLMIPAIARWWPAFLYSSLMILPDLSCVEENKDALYGAELSPYCLCDQRQNDGLTNVKFLEIRLAEESLKPLSNDDRPSSPTTDLDDSSSCWVGCPTIDVENAGHEWMQINRQKGVVNVEQRRELQLNDIVHEFGHAIGLKHEHQRPDRDRFLRFDCSAVCGYEEARNMAFDPGREQDWADYPYITPRQKMERICSEKALAEKFLPAAVVLLPDIPSPEKDIEGYSHDREYFDYGSIMIYPSDLFHVDRDRPPLARRVPPGYRPVVQGLRDYKYWLDENYYPGAAVRPRDRRISLMDVKRVAQLYPGTKAQQDELAKLKITDSWKPIPAKDMVDNHLWGHQFYKALKDFVLKPNPADVVDTSLRPITEPAELVASFYKPFCGGQSLQQCAQRGLEQIIGAATQASCEISQGEQAIRGAAESSRKQRPQASRNERT